LSPPRLDIVVVNWNAGRQLRECIDSIAAARKERFELERVVVVDNASRDGSVDALARGDIPLSVIRNTTNRGFAGACNQGASGSRSEYLLFLNPDTRLFDDSLDVPVGFLEEPAHAAFGVCGLQLVDASGRIHRSCARHPTPRHVANRLLGLDRVAPRPFPSHAMVEWDHAQDREVDHVMGAFLLVRRPLFDALGGFDTRFFVYLEDLDLTLRARRLGQRTMFLARARAYHRSGGTSEQAKAERLCYSLRSRMLYGRKHFGRGAALALDAGTLVVEPVIRLAAAALRLRWREAGETLRGFGLLWRATLRGRNPAAAERA